MRKLKEFLSDFLDWNQDHFKHIALATICNWVILVVTAFLGVQAGIYASITFIVLFAVWEVVFYDYQAHNKWIESRESIKDFLIGTAVILPVLMMLIKMK